MLRTHPVLPRRPSALLSALAACALLVACGGGGGSSTAGIPGSPDPGSPDPGNPDPGSPSCEGESFDSTFEAIQKVVFEGRGCSQQACHGSGASGALDLSPEVAYANLLDAPSLGSALRRVVPGDNDRSYLYLKLAASTRPGTVDIGGAPMPLGLPPLSENELEAVRLWIYSGAPREGTVIGTEGLLDACLPEPEPITIKPLDPPPPGEGVQLVMPRWLLPANSEHEVCFASYYDISDQVPAEFRDPSGRFFRFAAQELRQDPQSHHLILNYSNVAVANIHDPAFGEWTCKGGVRAGESCEPTLADSCGDGLCATAYRDGFTCNGFGPPVQGGISNFSIGGAQQAQQSTRYADGVFAQIPMKGILYWNSHAFNLTDLDHPMNARLNYWFATPENQRHPVRGIFNVQKIFSANAEPYTTQLLCNDHVLPQGAQLFNLSSHTHQRGKHFTIDLADGSRIYESFVYNDPVSQTYDPPLTFDSPDAADRTLHYCSLYNNGVNDDGSPDPEAVTRLSRLPASVFIPGVPGRCRPVACAEGALGAPCDGEQDDAACDSSPGAGDGMCDACRITGGESTENEMFILIGQYYVPGDGTDVDDPLPGRVGAVQQASSRAPERSSFAELAIPPVQGCAASHGGHGEHAGH